MYYTPARVMDDFFYDATDITVALSEVEVAQTGGCLVVVRMRLEL